MVRWERFHRETPVQKISLQLVRGDELRRYRGWKPCWLYFSIGTLVLRVFRVVTMRDVHRLVFEHACVNHRQHRARFECVQYLWRLEPHGSIERFTCAGQLFYMNT